MTSDVYVYDAIRTPRGKGKAGGSLYTVKPVDLVVGLMDELRRRHPGLDPQQIDDVVLGCVSAVGDQGCNIAMGAAMKAGLPDSICGMQLNRYCASGLEAVNTAAQKVASGWDELVLAGGVESMSRVPMFADGGAWMTDPDTNYSTRFVMQGIAADLVATLEGFSRADVDEFAVMSHLRAARAQEEGRFDPSIVPVVDVNGTVMLDRDETVRPNSSLETMAKLKPSFAAMGDVDGFDSVALEKYHWIDDIDHVHHAGNSSGIVDGAALVLIGNAEQGRRMGLTPRARILSTAVTGVDPTLLVTGPAPATRKALSRTGLTIDQMDVIEVNEAFAAVVLRFARDMDIDLERVNVNGGAIALGHPLGATGAMMVGTALDELERSDGQFALATVCAGGGIGIASVLERV